MKKKFFLGMLAVAGMLLATSCQNDELDPVTGNGKEATVSFTIGLNNAVGTRAISDGLTVNKLYWEVYDSKGNEVETLKGNKSDAFANKTATVEFNLAKGQTYTFAFWAQKDDTYDADDLTCVVLDCADNIAEGNDENRDAFYACTEPITINGDFQYDVTLKRPFAQLNLAVSDLDAFKAAGMDLSQVQVEVSEVANTFNVTTGQVGDAVPMTFSLADVLCNGAENPVLTLKKGIGIKDDQGADVLAFPWLSMNYILVNDGGNTGAASSNVDVTFTVKTTHDDVVLKSNNTPVQRNFRTNLIAGIADKGTFSIEIDSIYDGETDGTLGTDDATTYGVKAGDKYYKTLKDAVAAKETDIQLAAGEYVIDFGIGSASGDFKLTGVSTDDVKVKIEAREIGMSGVTLATFENLTLVTDPDKYYMFHLFGGFTHAEAITFNGCKFENLYWCWIGGKTTFNDCVFNQKGTNVNNNNYNVYTYNCSDVEFNNCKFYCTGTSVNIEADPNLSYTPQVSFMNCEFYASKKVDGITAIEVSGQWKQATSVYIENCTAEGFDRGETSGSILWDIKKDEENNCKVILKGNNTYGEDLLQNENGELVALSAKGVKAAISADATEIGLAANTYSASDFSAANKTIRLKGVEDNVVLTYTQNGTFSGSTVTLENITLKAPGGNYQGLTGMVSATFKNCTFEKLYCGHGGKQVFEDCVFNADGDERCIWTYASFDLEFKNCVFNYGYRYGKGDRCINVYIDNGTDVPTTLDFTNCIFNDLTDDSSLGAVEINSSSFRSGVTVNFDGCTAPDYGVMVFCPALWDSAKGENATITIDGEPFTPPLL